MNFSKGSDAIFQFYRGFFPFQLLVAQLKFNLLSLLYWTFLFLIISGNFGSKYGLNYLFCSPEYLEAISGWSFFFLGFALGGFIMAFNIFSYLRLGPHFPFLATLYKPFFKFCLNNAIVPLVFTAYFMYEFSVFQSREEFADALTVLMYNGMFLLGIVVFSIMAFAYFFPTNKDFFKISGKKKEDIENERPFQSIFHKPASFETVNKERRYLYFGKKGKIYRSRSIIHYDAQIIHKVFSQNKLNASIFELATILVFLILGIFREYTYFSVPAATSIILLLTIILMLFSALQSWLGNWTYPIVIVLFLSMNYISTRSGLFQYDNFVYGLSYENENLTTYSVENIQKKSDEDLEAQHTFTNYISILEAWKIKTGEKKPKLIIVNSSGGGSRSSLWTFTVLQEANKITSGKFMDHVQLITGASGGMIGAAYYREVLLRYKKGEISDPSDLLYRHNIGKDLLNNLSFAASTNDIFVRYQKVKYDENTYTKDRGYAFELQLNANTQNFLNHDLKYYTDPERQALIPVMIFSPTIVNDGRRLLISSQKLNFLTGNHSNILKQTPSYENIDYLSFFSKNTPEKTRFTSVIRMSATFPYVLPMATLPTAPEIQVMDAGIRDNYGGKTMMEFLYATREWIEENTSGVIIMQIRDTKKILNNEFYKPVSLMDKLTIPFGNMYSNFTKTQDFDQEELMKIGIQQMPFKVDLLSFNLRENWKDKISLSLHLTTREKLMINKAFNSISNQSALHQLKSLINSKN